MTPDNYVAGYFFLFAAIFFIGMVHQFTLSEDDDDVLAEYSAIGFLWPLLLIIAPFVALAYGIARLIKKFKR